MHPNHSQLSLALEPIRDLYDSSIDGKSNTMELFDALVTFSPEHARKGDDFLEVEKRINNRVYKVIMKPATLKKAGKLIHVLPARRESLVEKALRKLAVDRRDAIDVSVSAQGNHELWVNFTMHELRSLLNTTKHEFKICELVDALTVLVECSMEIQGETDREIGGIKGCGILSEIVWRKNKNGDIDGRGFRIAAKFHPLVTKSILDRTFRRIDFAKLMTPKNELFRWLYSRLSHNYIQASHDDIVSHHMSGDRKGYHILLSTIIRETGSSYSDLRTAARAVRTALKVARESGVILSRDWCGLDFKGYTEDIRYGPSSGKGRPPIADILFRLYPSTAVVQDILNECISKKGQRELTSRT